MPPTLCYICGKANAKVIRPKNHAKICKACFLSIFEDEIHRTIIDHKLFEVGEDVAIGASGGKDSTVLAAVLKTLNERHDYGLNLQLLSIDEGIKGYRDDSLATVQRNAQQYQMPLTILGYNSLYGWTMDAVVEQTGGAKGSCTYCGVFRRQALDRGAAKLGVRHVVTGHNADDIAETVIMNLLRGDLPRLKRGAQISTEMMVGSEGSLHGAAADGWGVKRSKPLMYAYEKEIVLYAHYRQLEYFSTECVYAPEAFRGSARTLIKSLERIRPSAILDVVRSGLDMAKMVPEDANKCSRTMDEIEGGCSSAGASGSVDAMVAMEQKLTSEENARWRETEISSDLTRITNGLKKTRLNPKPTQQTMQRCQKCGYLSSQKVCKACILLEDLNKSKPRVEIET